MNWGHSVTEWVGGWALWHRLDELAKLIDDLLRRLP